MDSIEISLDETQRLRAEVNRLTAALRKFEAGEADSLRAKEEEELALKKIEVLQSRLQTQDNDLLASKAALENLLQKNTSFTNDLTATKKREQITQDLLDSGLSASRHRILELQKAHNHLLKRYTALQDSYMQLKELLDRSDSQSDPPLLSGGTSTVRPRILQSASATAGAPSSPSPALAETRRRNFTMGDAELDAGYSPFKSLPGRGRGEAGFANVSIKNGGSEETRSPVMGSAAQGAAQYHFGLGPGSEVGVGRGSMGSEDYDSSGSKPRVRQEVRHYGRGMFIIIFTIDTFVGNGLGLTFCRWYTELGKER